MPAAPVPAKPQPQPAPVPLPVPTPQPAKKGGRAKWFVGAALVAGVLLYLGARPDPITQQACDTAFDKGTRALAAGDLGAARNEAVRAAAACADKSRSKADALQAAIVTAENADNVCVRKLRSIESDLEDHRLALVRDGLNQLTSACSANSSVARLRQQLTKAQNSAQSTKTSLHAALAAKKLDRARALLVQLNNINRDDPDLVELTDEVDKFAAGAAADTAAAAAAAVVDDAQQSAAPPPPARTANPENGQKSMAAILIRDAEKALSQRKFDAAKTYVDSARRMDPGNPRLDSLTRQIREEERQLLQQETTIR
jgi:hypothetical protein